VIRSMICHLLGLPPRDYILFDVACGACATLAVFGGKGVLTGLNQGISDLGFRISD
jgi:hypothetical protein